MKNTEMINEDYLEVQKKLISMLKHPDLTESQCSTIRICIKLCASAMIGDMDKSPKIEEIKRLTEAVKIWEDVSLKLKKEEDPGMRENLEDMKYRLSAEIGGFLSKRL